MKAQGLKAGASDNIIWATPPRFPKAKGAVIELKRGDATYSDVTPAQRDFLEARRLNGYLVRACFGVDAAMEQLLIWGW